MSPHASVHARDRPIKALKAAMQTTCIAMVVRLAWRSSHCMLPSTIRYEMLFSSYSDVFSSRAQTTRRVLVPEQCAADAAAEIVGQRRRKSAARLKMRPSPKDSQ